MNVSVLMIPGLWHSGPQHWQTHWEAKHPEWRVGPSDVEAPNYPEEGRSFSVVPRVRLPFPSLVVASSDDPYVSIDRARSFADAWGSRLVDIGPAGHINAASGYGPWPEGEAMLIEFCETIAGL